MFQLQQLYQIKIFNADHQVKMTETESMTVFVILLCTLLSSLITVTDLNT